MKNTERSGSSSRRLECWTLLVIRHQRIGVPDLGWRSLHRRTFLQVFSNAFNIQNRGNPSRIFFGLIIDRRWLKEQMEAGVMPQAADVETIEEEETDAGSVQLE